ncbi:MAG: gliding motility-associated C-terminal domain-containing protein, partial [Bacteroidota bacterium]
FGGSFINEPPPLVPGLSATGETSPGAGDGTATANPSGGTSPYDFLWSNGATTAQISSLVLGDYSVTITDFNGCTIADTIALPVAGCDLSVSILATNAACFQSATGKLSATAIGDMPPFNFLWSNGETTPTIDSLPTGQYFVTVTDAASCTATATTNVGQPGALPLPVYAVFAPDTVCGNTTFTLEADDLFQSAAVAYAWRLPTGDTLPSIEPFLEVTALSTAFSGEYFVARDSAGCRSQWVGGAPVEVVSLPPGAAFAGNDTLLCNPAQIQLAAQLPPVGVGEWHSLSGDDISQPNSSTTTAQISEAGEHVFIWQVAVAACPQAAVDTVTYFVEAPPILQDDAWTLKRAHDKLVMNILLNDNLAGLQDTVLTQLDSPVSGDLEFLPEQRQFRYTAAEGFRGTVQFHYIVCNPLATCGVGCDTALVTIEVLNLPTVPEALVIDDPGLNGLLIISGIQGLRVELSIFNRWGDLVYEEKEYSNENPWKGRFQRTGQVLPHGAYFFYLNAFEK